MRLLFDVLARIGFEPSYDFDETCDVAQTVSDWRKNRYVAALPNYSFPLARPQNGLHWVGDWLDEFAPWPKLTHFIAISDDHMDQRRIRPSRHPKIHINGV